MSTMTTSATIVNLFWTGYLIKKKGVQFAMSQQTLWAAFRFALPPLHSPRTL